MTNNIYNNYLKALRRSRILFFLVGVQIMGTKGSDNLKKCSIDPEINSG